MTRLRLRQSSVLYSKGSFTTPFLRTEPTRGHATGRRHCQEPRIGCALRPLSYCMRKGARHKPYQWREPSGEARIRKRGTGDGERRSGRRALAGGVCWGAGAVRMYHKYRRLFSHASPTADLQLKPFDYKPGVPAGHHLDGTRWRCSFPDDQHMRVVIEAATGRPLEGCTELIKRTVAG